MHGGVRRERRAARQVELGVLTLVRLDATKSMSTFTVVRALTRTHGGHADARILGLRVPNSQAVRGSGAHDRDECHAKRICY